MFILLFLGILMSILCFKLYSVMIFLIILTEGKVMLSLNVGLLSLSGMNDLNLSFILFVLFLFSGSFNLLSFFLSVFCGWEIIIVFFFFILFLIVFFDLFLTVTGFIMFLLMLLMKSLLFFFWMLLLLFMKSGLFFCWMLLLLFMMNGLFLSFMKIGLFLLFFSVGVWLK